eukprot:CAMPEP_0119047524 /NCGR_PEP_ID=MMETSP1177-20130426/53602_1 /TAXON_ID=2985 /ORGANISM="Ochromonas sp, Strain CCMP1899" /LENGTH=294 /DNA_ID=CAMNT_0007022233 /DNA_START=1172 /DNA_END=2057 /DNA_ORIENTATION=+
MSECVNDMKAFSTLKDSVVDFIQYSNDPALNPAKELFERINERKLYVCVGKTHYRRGESIHVLKEEEIKQALINFSREPFPKGASSSSHLSTNTEGNFDNNDNDQEVIINEESNFTTNSINNYNYGNNYESNMDARRFQENEFNDSDEEDSRENHICWSQDSVLSVRGVNDPELLSEDLIVEKMHIHHGQGQKNPVANVRFFRKNDPNTIAVEVSESSFVSAAIPREFEELNVRVFCKNPEKVRSARKAFELWCTEMKACPPYPSCSQVEPSTPTQKAISFMSEAHDRQRLERT